MSQLGWYTKNCRDFPGARPKYLTHDVTGKQFIGWDITKDMTNDFIMGLTARHYVMLHHDDLIEKFDKLKSNIVVVRASSMKQIKQYLSGSGGIDHIIIDNNQYDIANSYEFVLRIHVVDKSRSIDNFKDFVIPRSSDCLVDDFSDSKVCNVIAIQSRKFHRYAEALMVKLGYDADIASLTSKSLRLCALCSCGENLQVCAKCKEVYYCGKKHQKQHWPVHKNRCKLISEAEKMKDIAPIFDPPSCLSRNSSINSLASDLTNFSIK